VGLGFEIMVVNADTHMDAWRERVADSRSHNAKTAGTV